jgi:hypothetical protein
MLRPKPALAMLVAPALVCCGSVAGPEDTLSFTLVRTCLTYGEQVARVFRSAAEWQDAHRRHGREPAPPVDFSRSMVAAWFDRPGSACTSFSAQGVSLESGEIVVDATRHNWTGPCILVLAHPQLVLAIDKRDAPVRFRLRDLSGQTEGPARACY